MVKPKDTYDLAVEKGWYEGVDVNSPQWQMAMIGKIVGELGECAKAIQKGHKFGEFGTGSLAEELPDVRMLVDQLAYALGIDIEYWLEMKFEYNKSRKHRHGDKLI